MERKFKKSDWKATLNGAYKLARYIPSNTYIYIEDSDGIVGCRYSTVKRGLVHCGNNYFQEEHYLVVFESEEPFDGKIITVRKTQKNSKNSQPWTKEVVFKTYCNDNLYELPLGILEDMRSYLDNIIDNKKEIER